MISSDFNIKRRIVWIIIFSIAMGILEGAVVVYLRELYYPEGFSFPLVVMDNSIALVELLREVATIIMLAGIGILAGRKASERLSFFILSFAVWDLIYYVFLKLTLGWPQSVMDWDILFLVPVPWIGPVLTPILITATMMIYATALLKRETIFSGKEWLLVLSGSLTVVVSWTIDFQLYAYEIGSNLKAVSSYVPQHYPWLIFAIGEALLLAAIILFLKRTRVN